MEFTREEEKMIAWLERQHTAWRTTRLITLICALLCGIFSAWEFYSADSDTALPLLLLVMATIGLSYSAGSWAGRPEISLLLKLVKDARDRGRSHD